MSFYVAYVGEVIIRPEYREDFGHFFRQEYGRIESRLLVDFITGYVSDGNQPRFWMDNRDGRVSSYDKDTGVFRYSVTHKKYDKINRLLYDILPDITENVVYMNKLPKDGFFSSGEIVIKPEFRGEFEHLFFWEYDKLQYPPLIFWARNDGYRPGYFLDICRWRHHDCKKEWRGRYQTSYDEHSGLFVYGVYYNSNSYFLPMREFFDRLLPALAGKVLSGDEWDEGMDDDEDDEFI